MNIVSRKLAVVAVVFVAAAGCAVALASLAARPSQTDLPEGFLRDTATGIVLHEAPPAAQISSEGLKDQLVILSSSLSVKSFAMDNEGYLKKFTVNGQLGEYAEGTVLLCRSVTLNPDGTLASLVLAASAPDTGCDLKVTIGPNYTEYSCAQTACTTVCDTVVVKHPTTGVISIDSACRATP